MRFRITDEVFNRFPTYCVGLVVVEGVDNTGADDGIVRLLRSAEEVLRTAADGPILERPALATWRTAFKTAGIPPTRYRSSVEALATRTIRGDALPHLTPLVDLANALSLTYLLPLGAHDLDRLSGDLTVGPLAAPLPFQPMGTGEPEMVEPGEYVYADAEQVRTRRWVWRQSDVSKVTAATRAVVFPIDGWQGVTGDAVLRAMEELSGLLAVHFGVVPRAWMVDANRREVDLRPVATGPDTPVAVDGGFRMAGTGYLEARAPAAAPIVAAAIGVPTGIPPVETDAAGDLLRRRVVDVVVRDQLETRLRRGDRLRVKFGIDPTGPHLHLGHAVPFRKLREFQELGHTVCIVVGDFTAQIGDASDKTAQRQMLGEELVYQNLASYRRQIAKVLDPDRVEWTYNNDWLGPLRFRDVVGLATHFTVAQMLERENFALRYAAARPIGLQELLYPLMQGYDSVALRADIEIGGTEQLFNLMAGRTLQQAFGQAPQAVMTCPLLLGTDGQKMSKSTDNCIYLDEPAKEMYGKLMSITDEQILPYFELCTDVPLTELEDLRREMDRGINPMMVKKRLAYEVTLLYHPRTQALKAQQAFEQEVQRREVPEDIPEQVLPAPGDLALPDLLLALGLVTSKSEARRLAAQHGIRLDGNVVEDTGPVTVRNGMLVQVGKRKFARVRLHP